MFNSRSLAFLILTLGLSACGKDEPPSRHWVFSCEDGFHFEITYDQENSTALYESPNGVARLSVALSGSGARYTDGTLVFWNKGTSAFLELNGEVIHADCEGSPGDPDTGAARD